MRYPPFYSHVLIRNNKELGYSNERHTLASWYRVYEQKGEVKDKGREETKLSHVYSVNQVH